MKRRFLICLLAVVIFIFLFLSGRQEQGRIYAKKVYSLRTFLNIHESPQVDLIVDGVKCEDVIGEKPYYLTIDRAGKIAFVSTSPNGRGRRKLHIYDLESRKDNVYELKHVLFGDMIGSLNIEMADRASMTNGLIVLRSKMISGEGRVTVDLRNNTIEESY